MATNLLCQAIDNTSIQYYFVLYVNGGIYTE